MSKILICSVEEVIREKLKEILANHYELILTDSLEQANDVIKNAEIKTMFVDKNNIDDFQSKNSAVKVFPIEKPIKSDELLKACK